MKFLKWLFGCGDAKAAAPEYSRLIDDGAAAAVIKVQPLINRETTRETPIVPDAGGSIAKVTSLLINDGSLNGSLSGSGVEGFSVAGTPSRVSNITSITGTPSQGGFSAAGTPSASQNTTLRDASDFDASSEASSPAKLPQHGILKPPSLELNTEEEYPPALRSW